MRSSKSSLDNYIETEAKITAVEEQTYTVYPYTPKPSSPESINLGARGRSLLVPRDNILEAQRKREYNELAKMRNARLAAGNVHNTDPIHKTRYHVLYEFEMPDLRMIRGETLIYEKTDEYEVGRYINVKYKPSNPMANFPSSRPPAGF